MAVIRQLKNWFTKQNVYPQTVEKAIYDENGVRLDNKLLEIKKASNSEYDNTESGLKATNVQGAVDELNSSLIADNAQQFQFAYDSESGKYGYKAKVEGADTFFPFSSGSVIMSFSGGYIGSTTLTNVNSIDFSESNYSYESGSTKPYISLYGFKNDVSTTIFKSSTRPINKYDVSEYDYIVIRIGNDQGNNYQTYINNVLVEFS